jgi:hypothetical protein
MNRKKSKKGSTLLLAMVVISTVLFAGIGVATILSRQIKEIPTVENEAAGFYLAETVVDIMVKDGLEDFNCDSLSFVEWCEAEKIDTEYHIVVKVNNNYYLFVKSIGGGSGGEIIPDGLFTVYYNNPNNWDEVTMRYQIKGDTVYLKKMNEASEYPGWFKYEISTTNGMEIRSYFCDGPPEGNTNCTDDGMYPYPGVPDRYWLTDNIAQIFIKGDDAGI